MLGKSFCVNSVDNNPLTRFFNSLAKGDSSSVILQEFNISETEVICNGRLLLSHNSRLLLNLTTEGEIAIWFNSIGGDSNSSLLNTKNVNLRKLEISDEIFKNEQVGTKISEAIWTRSFVKDKNNINIEVTPTLILLERDVNIHDANDTCYVCKKNSSIKYLTIIQFSNVDKLEVSDCYNITKLEIDEDSSDNNIYDRPISINFNISNNDLVHNDISGVLNIIYCRIPVENIYDRFVNKFVINNVDDGKFCKHCFSHNNVTIFTDNSRESGFLMLIANMAFVSLDLDGSKSLYTTRRFLLQDYRNPAIRYTAVTALDNWLLSISIDTCELFLWNYNEGIGFLRFNLKRNIGKYIENKKNISTKLSFCDNISNAVLLIDYFNGLYSSDNSVEILLIDLDALFSEFLCCYYTVKLLNDRNKVKKYNVIDPSKYLRINMSISSGSIPHVQLDDEYINLTAYPNAFNNFNLNNLLEALTLRLSGGSSEYIKILKLTNNELNWSYFYNTKNWSCKEYYENNHMKSIILNTIDNMINDNNKVEFEFKELFDETYLNLIKSNMIKDIEYIENCCLHQNILGVCLDKFNDSISVINKINNNIKNKINLSYIKEYCFELETCFFKNNSKLSVNYYIDIIVNCDFILFQISDDNLINNHLSFCLNLNSQKDLNNNISLFDLKNEYSIINLNFSNKINWNYYILNKDSKIYMGIYSYNMSLLRLIYSTIKYQDLDNIKQICQLNNIDKSIIPVIQLEVGIKNSEIDMIKKSLNDIPSVLNLEIVKFAKSMLLDNEDLNLSDDFIIKSCEILLNFCLEKIKYYCNNNIKIYDNDNIEKLKSLSYYSSLFRDKLSNNKNVNSDASEDVNSFEAKKYMETSNNKLIKSSKINLYDEIYIRNEIIKGHYSSLINWWHMDKNNEQIFNFGIFRNNILYQVYKLICSQNANSLTLGIHMLRQIGENTSKYLKLILYFTFRRDVRKQIINHLKHINYLTENDNDLIQFNTQLENYYFNTCYYIELNRKWTSILTCSYPYDILKDYVHIMYDCDDNQDNSDDELDYYCDISKSLVYPFGGLRTLKDGIILNRGLNTSSYDNRMLILNISKIILKKLSSNDKFERNNNTGNYTINNSDNKEFTQINKNLFYSHFSKESLDVWGNLRCGEIQDIDNNFDEFDSYNLNDNNCYDCTNTENNNMVYDGELNNYSANISCIGTVDKSLPEQENSYLRLNDNNLVNIKHSVCKDCSDHNEDDNFDIENKMLSLDQEYNCKNNNSLYIKNNLANDDYDLPSDIDKKNDGSHSIYSNLNNNGDRNSKRGDLKWLKLHRERKSLMNNHLCNFGYINHSLFFVTQWPYDVAIRIIIEKTHLQICYIWNRILKGCQTPCKFDEAFVYSYIYIMIKQVKREYEHNSEFLLSNKIDLETSVFKKITCIIYNSLFSYIYSHFDWMNIPQSINYLKKTLNILFSNHNVKKHYKYELINEIISSNFKNSPKYINDVFIDSLISSNLMHIHHLKLDLLERKIFQIEINKFKNVEYIINRCTSYKKHGPLLFKYYLSKITELTEECYLNLFLRLFNKKKNIKNINDYLEIIYIFSNKKKELLLMLFRETFIKFKNTIDDSLFTLLLSKNSNDLNIKYVLDSPITMINILIDYFVNYSESSNSMNTENEYYNFDHTNAPDDYYDFYYDENNLNLRPHYVLSIIFALEFSCDELYNKNYELFLEKYFPKLRQVFDEKFKSIDNNELNISSVDEVDKFDINKDMNLFSISDIIKNKYKDFKTLIDLIDLFPEIRSKLDNSEDIEEVISFFSNKMYESIKKNGDLKKNSQVDNSKLNLPIINYVSKGRPFIAYILFCIRYSNYCNNASGYEDDSYYVNTPNITIEDKIDIYKAVYNLTIRNFTRDMVVSSSIIFISMLNLPTELLTTDVKVARCIYNHKIYDKELFPKFNYDTEMNIETDSIHSDKIFEIWNLFIKFGPPQIDSYIMNFDNNNNKLEFQDNQKYSNSLFTVLRMLEEAAWNTGDICESNFNNEQENENLDSENKNTSKLLENTQIWHLVAVFCRLHGLPRSLTLLHELARRGEWIHFLQECDSQKCPKETVENIINEYLSKYPVLKQHLKIALKMNTNDEDKESKYGEYYNKDSEFVINLFDWNILFMNNKSIELNKLNEFYEWSVENVFLNSIKDINGIKLLMYYSVIQEHICLFVNNNFNNKLRCLIMYTINSYLLIEFINMLILILKDDNKYCIKSLFNNIKFEKDVNIDNCKARLEKFTVFSLNDIMKTFSTDVSNINVSINKFDINNNLYDIMNYDDIKLTECTENLLFNSLVNISEIIESKYKIKEEYINSELNNNSECILCIDELSIILWSLMSILNERNFLTRVSNWFYGNDSVISKMFTVIEHLNNFDIENGLDNLNNILIINESEKNTLMDIYCPSNNLINMYYEKELLNIYKNISVKDHSFLWEYVYNIYSSSNENNINEIFSLKNHIYRKYIVSLLNLSFDEYDFNYNDIEKWLCMSEVDILEEMYNSGKFKLFIKYLEISQYILINENINEKMLILFEDSVLKLISNQLNTFTSTQLFKSNSVRYEYLSNCYWNLLKSILESVKKISLHITPYILTKISIYCWYLIEKLERLLTIIDQVILLSISLNFLSEAYKLIITHNLTTNTRYSYIIHDYFNLNYIYNCINYSCYKLLFLCTINLNYKTKYDIDNYNDIKIENKLINIINALYISNERDILNIDLDYKLSKMDYYENLFFKIRNISILFTPSGYFNFQNTNNSNFNIQLPCKIQFIDYPIDAKNLLSSIKNVTNYFLNLSLTFKLGMRFVPNVKNKLRQSFDKIRNRFNFLKISTNFDSKKNESDNNCENNIVNINRNSHIWSLIVNYLIEKYYISLMFSKIVFEWSKEDIQRINDFINHLNLEFQFQIKSVENAIPWEKYVEFSIENNNTGDSDNVISNSNKNNLLTSYGAKLSSLLRLFQYIHYFEKYVSKDKTIIDVKYNIKDLIISSGVQTDFCDIDFNNLFNDKDNLSGISNFIVNLFSTENITYIIKTVLLLSIEVETKLKSEHNETNLLKFDDLLYSIRTITINNIYLNTEKFDDLVIQILFEIIDKHLNDVNITLLLKKLSKLSLDHLYIIKQLNFKLSEYNEEINIKKRIYINLVIYYLSMTDFEYSVCETDAYYQDKIKDAINNINVSLFEIIHTDFDYQLFSNIISEIPELTSFSELNAEQINSVINNIDIYNITDNDNYKFDDEKNSAMPNNLLSMILSVRILEMYNLREKLGNNNIDLNILKKFNRIDLLSEFLINKCLIKQWNNVSIEFMFSKYGRFDLFVALQIILHSCELLKNTEYQQLYSGYLKLAGLFSVQVYFINSYIQKESYKGNNYLTPEMKKSIKSKLSCIIPNDYIHELFNEYNEDFNVDISSSTDKYSNKTKYQYETSKVNIINLDLIELFEIVSNNNICHNPIMTNVILSGYEIIFGPIVHAVWPRILFINSIILSNFDYIEKYTNIFGYLDFNLLDSMVNLHKNLLIYLENNEYDDNQYKFYNIVKSDYENEDTDFHVFNYALKWIERPITKHNHVKMDLLFTNWKKLISNYVEDILLRIEICNVIDSEKLSDIIFYNKKLYNDKSLYEIN